MSCMHNRLNRLFGGTVSVCIMRYGSTTLKSAVGTRKTTVWLRRTERPAPAHTLHALPPLRTAVETATTVPLVFLQVYAPAFAAGLGRAAAVGAAAAVAFVGLQLYAAVSTASLPFGASVVGPG